MRSPRLILLPAALLAIGSGVVGCGGEQDEAPAQTVTVGASDGVEVVGGEYFFDPEAVVVEGGSGGLEITLDNRGSLAHNLRVFDGATEVGGTATFPGGESRSARVSLDPGAYRMVCTVANHEELGMVGELEVR
jgi:plastocyanin